MVFESYASNLVAGDTNTRPDIFIRDMQAGTTTRVSLGPGGAQSSGNSLDATISDDGRFVAFTSLSNLESGGGKGLFIHDRQSGVTSGLSLFPLATNNLYIPYGARLAGDGGAVCSLSGASLSGQYGAFLIDRQTLTHTTRERRRQTAVPPMTIATTVESTVTRPSSPSSSEASNLVAGDSNVSRTCSFGRWPSRGCRSTNGARRSAP